jgi:hypothetical protein
MRKRKHNKICFAFLHSIFINNHYHKHIWQALAAWVMELIRINSLPASEKRFHGDFQDVFK